VIVGEAALVTETARAIASVDYSDAIRTIAAACVAMTFIVCATVFSIYDRRRAHEALLDARAYELQKMRVGKE
jgi:hypothetical protein